MPPVTSKAKKTGDGLQQSKNYSVNVPLKTSAILGIYKSDNKFYFPTK